MEMDTKLTLVNFFKDENSLIIQPNFDGNNDYISFSITIEGKHIPLSENELDPNDGEECYFNINKAQAKVLISYLKSLVEYI
jgi:hypothetical protein